MESAKNFPYIEILEQPGNKNTRFSRNGEPLNLLEGNSSVPGVTVFPTIKIRGYKGRAIVVVSCVTKDQPYMPHPHNIVGENSHEGGVHRAEAPDTMIVQFTKLTIQFVEKENIVESLRMRKNARVDPFQTGFNHETRGQNINLNVVRLCFQVFIEGDVDGKFNVQLDPVVTDPIFNKGVKPVIGPINPRCGSVLGGEKINMICDEIHKDDISIRFFEQSSDGRIVWESYAELLEPEYVNDDSNIIINTPKYIIQDLNLPVQVYVQLKRPSDGATSESQTFIFNPLEKKNKCSSTDEKIVNSWQVSIPFENPTNSNNCFTSSGTNSFASACPSRENTRLVRFHRFSGIPD